MIESSNLIAEFVYYVDPNGVEYPLFGGRRVLMSWRDFGNPPINYLSDKGPNQHGVTVRDYRFIERTITLREYERGCLRLDWWCHEGKLIDAMRPNRSSTAQPGKILVILPDSTSREIKARLTRGPDGNWNGEGSQAPTDLRENLTFFCGDPFWRDTTQLTSTFTLSPASSCLPTCLSTCLGGSNVINSTTDIVYTGTWNGDQITITLTGPMESPIITNETTNQEIKFNYTIAAGETVTVEIQPDLVTVVNNSGTNLIGTIDNISDLVTFFIATESDLTSDGTNTIRVVASESSTATTVILAYYTRHLSAFGAGC